MRHEHHVARTLLQSVGLAGLLDKEGRPTDEAWKRVGVLSSGEVVVAALAFSIAGGYSIDGLDQLNRIMLLDNERLRAVGEALIAMAGRQ